LQQRFHVLAGVDQRRDPHALERDRLGAGFYFQVGGTPQSAFDSARAGGPPVPSHHSPLFKIDPEPSVRLGAEAMTVAVLDLLKPGAPGH